MAQAIYHQWLFVDAAPRVRRAREAAERLALCLIRIALVLLVAFFGAMVVRNVTHALCVVAGQTPPAWTGDRR
jgi:hypothetical protein